MKDWLRVNINGNIKPILCVLAFAFAGGKAWSQLNAIQRTVNLAATQKSVDDLRDSFTDRVERLEGFHMTVAP